MNNKQQIINNSDISNLLFIGGIAIFAHELWGILSVATILIVFSFIREVGKKLMTDKQIVDHAQMLEDLGLPKAAKKMRDQSWSIAAQATLDEVDYEADQAIPHDAQFTNDNDR